MLSVAQVLAVAEAVPARFCVLVLLATFTSLRFGELAALRRCDVDLVAGDVHVRRSQSELRGRTIVKGPKSDAGRRSVSIPRSVVPELTDHLDGAIRSDQARNGHERDARGPEAGREGEFAQFRRGGDEGVVAQHIGDGCLGSSATRCLG